MSDIQFTGELGTLNSQFGTLSFGHDDLTEIWVTWTGYKGDKLKDSPNIAEEQTFGFDEQGLPIVLKFKTPVLLTRKQVIIALRNNALLVSNATLPGI